MVDTPIDDEGVFSKRTTSEILTDLIEAARAEFGSSVDVSPTGTIRKLLEAAVALPLAETQSELDLIYQNIYFDTAAGQNLDNLLEPFGFVREVAARAEGTVHINLKARVLGAPGTLFSSGSLEFKDSGNQRFLLIDDVDIPEPILNSVATGTNSELIDATRTRIAQKFSVVGSEFVQAWNASTVTAAGTPTFTVRVETDNVGIPSGVLAHANLQRTGWIPTSGTETSQVFVSGAVLDEGDYWLVFERTAGDARFDGGATGTANQVYTYNGTWAVSTLVENLNVEVIRGATALVRANDLGPEANVEANSINKVSFNTGSASTQWAVRVSSYTNLEEFEGGADEETDRVFRARVRSSFASLRSSSPDGIAVAVEELDGVRSVTVIENTTDQTTDIDISFSFDGTGVPSNTIDGTRTRIAQKFRLTGRRYVQHFNADLATNTGLTATVSIQADTAGSPSGTSLMSLTGFTFGGGTSETAGTFTSGRYLEADTDYWLVFERTAGSGTFDGANTGTVDQVKSYNGAWVVDLPDNINVSVIGGLPPHSFRVYPVGGRVDEIAQAIWDNRPAGILADGPDSGTATDRGGYDHLQYFERPLEVPVVLYVTATYGPSFAGNEDTIRDVLVAYIGGLDTTNDFQEGLKVSQKLVLEEAKSRILDDDEIVGLVDITVFRAGRKSQFATPAALTGTEIVNLIAASNEEFIVQTASTDITVNLIQDT